MINKKNFLKLHKRLLALVLVFATILGLSSGIVFEGHSSAANLPKVITLVQAKKLAIKNSSAIEKIEIQLDAKKAALSSAIKSIAVKKKNLSTFRWTPLLKFKFPKSPNLSEAYEFQYKPIKIQYEIDKLNHKLVDARLTEYEKVINLYVDIVVYEKRISFNETRADIMDSTLRKNQVKLLAGDATKTDVETMKKALDKIEKSLSADSRALVAAKKKMSNILKLDVTTRYQFLDPFLESDLTRDLLPDLIEYTLDRDDAYYDLCIDETSGRISVETNYNLLNGQYSRKYMNLISPYIKAALKGEDFSAKAFYKNYKQFVNTVNDKWKGKKRILFFKFPKSWFQGDIDGDRFIEDDPYGAYTAVLDYKDAVAARTQGEQDLKDAVEGAFDNYINVKSAYTSYVEQVNEAEENLEKATILNKAGELSYDLYKEQSDTFEDLQNSMLDSMKQYTQTLISFDRLTCGGVSAYLGDLIGDVDAGGGGESYVSPEFVDGAYYYIEPIIQSNQFKLRVSFPDDYDIAITDFELWIDGIQVGDRKPIDNVIRHLAFDLNGVTKAFIRFYNEGEFVDDVPIDPEEYSGPLQIIKDYNEVSDTEIGEYILAYSEIRNQYTLTLNMNPSENIKYYRIKDSNGAYLINDRQRDIDKPMTYLNTINASLGALDFEFFDESGALLYEGYADLTLMKLYKKVEE